MWLYNLNTLSHACHICPYIHSTLYQIRSYYGYVCLHLINFALCHNTYVYMCTYVRMYVCMYVSFLRIYVVLQSDIGEEFQTLEHVTVTVSRVLHYDVTCVTSCHVMSCMGKYSTVGTVLTVGTCSANQIAQGGVLCHYLCTLAACVYHI